ncbi:hypothetical protein SAMN05216342_2739 [Exiguobacterium indicum]|nr:hypothetical protein SAMN05216342_2739 [Exiguobacterium enclense]
MILSIVHYNQLSRNQKRHVHQLLQHNQWAHDISFFQLLEGHQFVYLKHDLVYATLGYRISNEMTCLMNGAYSNISAFHLLAKHLHEYLVRQGAQQIKVQVVPPQDGALSSVWKTLGYTLSAEQFRLIGISNDRVSSLRFQPIHARNQELYLTLRNHSIKGCDHLFPYHQEHYEQFSHSNTSPYLIYDQQLVIGTLLYQKYGRTIRLLEITCLPELKYQGYGRRILDTFQAKLCKANIKTFETIFHSTNLDVLRLYQKSTFCDIQLFSHWHTFQVQNKSLTT